MHGQSDRLVGTVAGTLVFAIGVYLHFVGPRRSLPWLALLVYLAWIGEQVGARFLGSYLGGLVGAALITLVAYMAEAVAAAPPSRVMFLPAFWLLVPGALAVIGLAELVGNELEVALLEAARWGT